MFKILADTCRRYIVCKIKRSKPEHFTRVYTYFSSIFINVILFIPQAIAIQLSEHVPNYNRMCVLEREYYKY